ncbi:MAG: hypothetical protein HUJ68_03595 [Clostridia bacterium]|nr:hypothetical protein [Clostridia bacterium]
MPKNNSTSSKIKALTATDKELKPGTEIEYIIMKQDTVTLFQILTILNKLSDDVKDIKSDVKDLKIRMNHVEHEIIRIKKHIGLK